jgi:hypothetical protein
MTSGAIYPGVPLVSEELSGLQILAIPMSVTLTYPRNLEPGAGLYLGSQELSSQA